MPRASRSREARTQRPLGVVVVPFQAGYDFSVFDHIEYLAVSDQPFQVPSKGSVTGSTTSS
jgi:hypothetical protein